uniref:Uncharacterized protein n=1 Tax=viral metagenome TaxID=1070528 RepID=A0A6C0CJX9_9ZZZZ
MDAKAYKKLSAKELFTLIKTKQKEWDKRLLEIEDELIIDKEEYIEQEKKKYLNFVNWTKVPHRKRKKIAEMYAAETTPQKCWKRATYKYHSALETHLMSTGIVCDEVAYVGDLDKFDSTNKTPFKKDEMVYMGDSVLFIKNSKELIPEDKSVFAKELEEDDYNVELYV